ncbi:SEL1-like repeat protein [Stenotrophomonas maltophilia]|uniref:SEL1-like repeat protein n=2 Tax=Lysobacteraceae TaxID=32033 RepID=UPI0013122091
MAMSRKGRGVWMLVAALAALPAWGQSSQPDLRAQDAQDTDAFLNRHPDLRYRKLGKEAQARGRLEEARRFYRLGARHADKLSQAALAEMWWNGQGGGQDRALAYAWMDLAAERGTEFLLVLRERYWAALTPDEQTRAVQEGQALYAEFGDTVAQPRLERELRRGLSEVTGSRTGSVGGMRMLVRDDRGQRYVEPDVFYRDEYWQPAQYWQWQARQLEAAGRAIGTGSVEVGMPTTVPGLWD